MTEQEKAEAFVAYLLVGDPDVETVKARMRHLKRRREETGRAVLEIIADETGRSTATIPDRLERD